MGAALFVQRSRKRSRATEGLFIMPCDKKSTLSLLKRRCYRQARVVAGLTYPQVAASGVQGDFQLLGWGADADRGGVLKVLAVVNISYSHFTVIAQLSS